jgi:L-serine dehydratase
MNISLFDVVGPVMIGPSSSHTAGAAKLARVASGIAPRGFSELCIQLAGSFAKTGKGHGTDKALLAGALGFSESDERIREAYKIADERGIKYAFSDIDLPDAHENTARLTFKYADKPDFTVEGSSIGGGRIIITEIDGSKTSFNAEAPTIVIRQLDKPGVVNDVSGILAESGINIAVMRLDRDSRGGMANCVIETDANIDENTVSALEHVTNVVSVRAINL